MGEVEGKISDLGDALVKLVNQLIDKGSHLELEFMGLSLDFRGLTVTLNGKVLLDVSYVSKV